MSAPTRAIVHIDSEREVALQQISNLKRLALIFDEIHFVMSDLWIIRDELLCDRRLFVPSDDGLLWPVDGAGIDPVQHTHPAIEWPLHMLADELQETLYTLMDRGVAQKLNLYDLKAGKKNQLFDRARHRLAWQDAKDETFSRLSGTMKADYEAKIYPLKIEFEDPPPDEGHSKIIYVLAPPQAILDSIDISATFFAAHETSSFPVFQNGRHRREVGYRYMQFQKGRQVLEEMAADLLAPSDFRATFGEVSFTVMNGVVSSDILVQKSIHDVLNYRDAMDIARRRFVSEDLMGIAGLVQDNPWSNKTKQDVERYILGKLNSSIAQYDSVSRETWEKFYGTATTSFAEVVRNALGGAAAGGVLGQAGTVLGTVLPHMSSWQLLLLASLASSAKIAPGLIKDAIEAVRDDRQLRRSSVAYIAEFK
ncbi:MAG: hypothetical protein QOF33_4186 [Thermomicrobiales bacterium]|jgi:hypothetical protein|nr:hypothetical protein [Thermomicrobiales bacterium]